MKKINIELGGHPVTGDDLLFMQASVIDTIKMFLDTFVGDAVILSGCETTITGSGPFTISWTAGFLYMNGEIFQVDSGSAAYTPSQQEWVVAETADSAGTINYEDGSTVDTYKIRKAELTGTSGGTYKFTNFKRLKNYRAFGAAMSSLGGDWNSTGSPIGPQYNKNLLGNVFFNGFVNNASFNNLSDELLFTLPADYRPNIKQWFQLAGLINGSPASVQVSVDTNGEIRVLGVTNTNSVTVYLNQLVVSLAI